MVRQQVPLVRTLLSSRSESLGIAAENTKFAHSERDYHYPHYRIGAFLLCEDSTKSESTRNERDKSEIVNILCGAERTRKKQKERRKKNVTVIKCEAKQLSCAENVK